MPPKVVESIWEVRPALRPLASVLPALTVVIAVLAAGPSLTKVSTQALERSRDSQAERELAPVEMALLEPEVFEVARRTMAPGDTYAVLIGYEEPRLPVIARDAVQQFAPFWLLPRRRVYDPRAARWVISYGGDLGSLSVRYRRVIRISPGVALAEVAG